MLIKRTSLAGLIFLIHINVLQAQQFGGNPPSLKWNQLNTPEVRVIFPKGLEKQAQRVAALASALQFSTQNTIDSGKHKVNIVLQNQTIIANGYVSLAPYRSEFYMTPDQDNFSLGSLPWTDNLTIHEYRHIQQYNNFNRGLTKVFGFFGGEQGRALANAITVPDWFFEGDAVFQETLVSQQGRGRMPSFLNEFKSIWQQNKNYSWMKLRNGSLKDLVPNHYPLGYQLVAYGYEKYGTDFWKKVTNDATRFKGLFYAFSRSIKQHSGKSYVEFRKDALNYFRELSVNSQGDERQNFITHIAEGNVVSYLFPYADGEKLIVLKRSYNEIPAFYKIDKNGEHKIRIRDIAIDDYYSYNNGKVVYSAYNKDARWGYKEYSDIRLLDVASGKQIKLTSQKKYFSPDISADGSLILAVEVLPDGNNTVHIINAVDGSVQNKIPNRNNYFFTQTRFLKGNQSAVSAVRDKMGRMALVKLNLINGETEPLTPFTYNVLGYPFVKGDTILFNRMDRNSDKLFAIRLADKRIFRLTDNENSFYHPILNDNGDLLYTGFTADGYRLAKINRSDLKWQEVTEEAETIKDRFVTSALNNPSAKILNSVVEENYPVSKYRQATRLFNFHSWEPYIAEPEYGINFHGNNVLNTLQSNLYYIYNRDEQSHFVGFTEAFGGFYPVLSAGLEGGFNRPYGVRYPDNTVEIRYFNSATLFTGVSLPLSFTNGRTFKNINLGFSYNLEQRAEGFPGKEILSNRSFDFLRGVFSFSNISQQARQNIYPRWAQALSINYRDAITLRNNKKLVATTTFVFPGLFANDNIVINGAYQKRDTLPDLFSKIFPFSRGYEALNTRRMYRLGINYHFPLAYPDWGFANLIYFTRIRANIFFDYTNARAKYYANVPVLNKSFKSVGTEIYFDTKIWNQLPVSIGVRYSNLLDDDLLTPGRKGLWEIILPLSLFSN
ncbi:MAG TPA: hypothetical protein VFN30_04465 [Chitinophagaceae bacterium]|nr:hypothetical protein [Chitinophagaceae bacterium]